MFFFYGTLFEKELINHTGDVYVENESIDIVVFVTTCILHASCGNFGKWLE